jgi:hypothetical protein
MVVYQEYVVVIDHRTAAMATTTASIFHALDARLHRFMGVLATLFEGIREGREMAARYDQLSKLSDGELARRGIARSEIVNRVVNGRGA